MGEFHSPESAHCGSFKPSLIRWRHLLDASFALAFALTLLIGVSPARGALPPSWTDADVGSPSQVGSAVYSNGSWTVAGGGSDIWNNSDQFNFVSQAFDGDGSLIAQVLSIQNSDPGTGWSKAGVMFRNDNSAGSINATVVITAGNGVAFQWRLSTGAATTSANISGLTAPIWVKLTRAGNNFSGYYSVDGQTWNQIGATQTVSLNTNILAGLAVTAHNNAALNTATFTNVSATTATLPLGWTDVDIGSPALAGTASDAVGLWTVAGGGADIFGSSDQFNFASEDFNGDGTVIAQVLSLQNTDSGTGSARAGVMLRNDNSAGAANVAAFISAGNGVGFQWRSATGGPTSYVAGSGLVAPVWLKLARAGNNFSAYYSSSGQNWIQIGTTQTISLNTDILAGLAVTAHTNSALNTATFTNVTVSFVGPPVTLPVVTNFPAVNVQATTATLAGQIVSAGNQNPVVTLFYGPADGGSNAAAWENNIVLAPQSGNYALTVTGLATNTVYYYTALASNAAGSVWAAPSITFTTRPSLTSYPILTFQYDNTRAGANTNETILTPANANFNNLGKLFTYNVDGYVFAQALVATNVTIPGHGVHNVLYVVTENDTIYAFDADQYVPTPYWTNSFINAAAGVFPVPGSDANGNIYPEIGITATPVIDPTSGTIYIEARTKEISGNTVNYMHRLHALDIATGLERTNYNSPVAISANNYPGTGTPGYNDTDGAGHVLWNGLREQCRAGLLLSHGMIYIAYASPGDHSPYYGWVFAYDAHTLAQTAVFNDDPNAGLGGIWMSGGGVAADTNGLVYLATGNGNFDTNNDYGDSILRLDGLNGLNLLDYFTPYNQATLNSQDQDLGASGLILLPDSAGSSTHPHLLLCGSKTLTLYLVDRDDMGHYNPAGDSQIVQSVVNQIGGMWSSPAYFNGSIYVIGKGDVPKSFLLSNASLGTTPYAQAAGAYGASATPTISANGTNNAIVWAIDTSAAGSAGPAVLHAYAATNLAQELYNSSQNASRDYPGAAVEFTLPTVVNGKVYVGCQYAMSVFGNGSFLALPTISPGGMVFSGSVAVTLGDPISGATFYYTLDGSAPATNSILYTGPFILTNTTAVHVVAVKPGYMNSGVASAVFVNSASLGSGTGLTGSYYSNQTSANPYTGSPTLVRVDPTINFNWDFVPPDPSIGLTNYTVRWIGSVQPQFNETYTFYATADDGVRLWVNGQELVNGWVDESATTYQGSIPLVAQQLYNIEMDYYQDGGYAVAQLAWASPSTPQAIIPQTQLYPYSNPPPTVVLSSPTAGSSFTAAATVSITAEADAPYNPISYVSFYTNGSLAGLVSNAPYSLTVIGLSPGAYTLTATATDGSGLTGASAPVGITVTAGSGLAYGLTNRPVSPAFFNMPNTYTGGPIPLLLSQTGVFNNTPSMSPTDGLVPYAPNTPFWSDGALKIRYMSVPNTGGPDTPNQQIGFASTGEWTFPSGTVFVKTFELQTNQSDPNSIRRLETRLLVRDTLGAVYGVTYKWRPDNSDADLLTTSQTEPIVITNNDGASFVQDWYYPSPADCLACHTAAAGYVLGVNTRQLNGNLTYPSSVTDDQLRALNRAGLFYPAIDESQIAGFTKLSSVTNLSAPLVNRARSYLDANCAQCHRPGGTGPSFDARYDTPLASQSIINGLAIGNLGYDHAAIVVPSDIWRSVLYDRMNTVDPLIKMPPLARNLIDTNAVQVMAAWINTLGGTPAEAPPSLAPASGIFTNSVALTLQPPDANATLYYTLDGTLPTTNSVQYTGPFNLNHSAVVMANAFESGYVNSVAVSGLFTIVPPLDNFFSPGFASEGVFQMQFWAPAGKTYVLQASSDLIQWTSISTNTPAAAPFYWADPDAASFPHRFYRVITP